MKNQKIITREEWNALPFPTGKPLYPMVPLEIVIHHFGGTEYSKKAKTSELFKGGYSLRKLQKYSRNVLKKLDIGFHYVIGSDGNIYECRPPDKLGSHLPKGMDKNSIGILMYGNFNYEELPHCMKESLVWLLRYLKSEFSTLKFPDCVKSHAERQPSVNCPGKNVYYFVLRMRKHCEF